MRGELETGTDCYILTQSSSDHSCTSSSFGLVAQPWVSESPNPSVCLWFSRRHRPQLTPTSTGTATDMNWPKPSVTSGYIIVFRAHASCGCMHQPGPQVKMIFRYLRPDASVSLFFRLFTQVHLLINGSVEGQYVSRHTPNNCLGYDIKHSDGEAPIMLEIWGMWSAPLLASLTSSLWPGVFALGRVLCMRQI